MLIKKDGIYRTIDPKEFGIFQSMGFEKVVAEEQKVEKVKVEKPVIEEEPIVEPKPKKKKKI